MKILIIEDEKELAASIAEYLAGENYLCEFAATFKDALDKIESIYLNTLKQNNNESIACG